MRGSATPIISTSAIPGILTAAGKDLEVSARDSFKRKSRGVVDTNLNGFIIDDVVVEYLEQRPSE